MIVALRGDRRLSAALLESPDPPLLLYRDRFRTAARAALAIVGSRHASVQGAQRQRLRAAHLGRRRLHHRLRAGAGHRRGARGARRTGSTIAVVATGLDQVYPRRHLALAGRIAAEGLLLSEHPLGTPPLRENFPQRNRLIAGLTRGTLVGRGRAAVRDR